MSKYEYQMHEIGCPYCGSGIEVIAPDVDHQIGREVGCPECQKIFVVHSTFPAGEEE